MSSGQIKEVSVRLEQLKTAIPNNFARKPRGLEHLERWKATEFRQFALYTGKLVLRGVLQDDLFEHFMAFSVAMCMLISPSLVQAHCSYAHERLWSKIVKRLNETEKKRQSRYQTSKQHLHRVGSRRRLMGEMQG